MVDQFGRTIEYLRLSITDRCNLRCQYCMPESGIEKLDHAKVLRNEDYLNIVRIMASLGIKKVRLTGGEPMVRKGLASLVSEIKSVDGIEEVTLTTNGILLEEQIEGLISAGISRINVSIDSLNPATYRQLTRGGDLSAVLRGIKKALQLGIKPLKINVVLIKGENDHEIDDFLSAFDPSVEVRFIELMPIGEAASWNKEKFIDLNALFSKRTDLVPVMQRSDRGPCRYYQQVTTGQYVGIINSVSEHFCGTCNRLRVTSDGMLKMCLHDSTEINLRPYLKNPEALEHIVKKAIQSKPEAHQLNNANATPIVRNMYTIGG